MKNNIQFYSSVLILIIIALTFTQCGDDDGGTPAISAPTITSFSPESGAVGTEVTITGTNFSTVASENIVKFNGTNTTVSSASATSLTVKVPQGATSGKIEVTVNNQSASSDSDYIVTNSDDTKTSTVYVAGYEVVNKKYIAKYWKNGDAVSLTDGTNFAMATAIAVAGDDVYIGGFEKDANEKYTLKYWKNGNAVNLTDKIDDGGVTNIAVDGTDVYVSGYEYSDGVSVAKYWKNGEAVKLSDGDEKEDFAAYARSITVVSGDVYVVGDHRNTNEEGNAIYWKNGTAVALERNPSQYSWGHDLVVSGSDIYVAGAKVFTNGIGTAVYWKNGTAVHLTDGTHSADAKAIFVAGNDIYVVGHEVKGKYIAKYWLNGTSIDLTNGNEDALATDIAVVGDDVYISGYEESGGDTGLTVAKYWKNGEVVNLTEGESSKQYGLAIAVVEK